MRCPLTQTARLEALQTRLHTANDAYRAAVQEARTYWPLTQTRCLDSSTRCSSACAPSAKRRATCSTLRRPHHVAKVEAAAREPPDFGRGVRVAPLLVF